MTMSALIVVKVAERVVGLTANERFKAIRNLDSGGSNFMTSKWFTIIMVTVLVGSVVTLAIVGWKKRRAAQREAEKNASSNRSVRKPAAPAAPVGQSRPSPAIKAKPQAKTPDAGPKEVTVRGDAYIALYSFSRKMDLSAKGKKPDSLLPQFVPAKVLNVTGKVVSVETALSANVGDRILVVIESQSAGEGNVEIIEDMGVVRQSAQPAETTDAPNARRLTVEIAGLNDTQAAQLAGIIPAVKKAETIGNNTSKPTETGEQAK
jgi:hypothetical protein